MTDGDIIGSVEAAVGSGPGDSFALSYSGTVTDGDAIATGFDTVHHASFTPDADTGIAYTLGVQSVNANGDVYVNSVYADGATVEADTAGGVDVDALIIGE